jgi:hypothetical protein
MSRLACITLALAAAAACGKGDAKDGPGSAKKGGDIPADHVKAVNDALPADLKGKLEFEAGKTAESEKKRGRAYKAAVPKGWKKGFMPGALEPADADNFGSKTLGKSTMRIDSNCDGECVKKDWAAVSDKVQFQQFTSGKIEGKLIKDEKRPNGRTLVFETKPGPVPEQGIAVYILTSWWETEGSSYHTCSAELGLPLKGAAAAFEKACSRVIEE